jgi:hypothetical protein
MTSETKITIGPEDILAVEIECCKCGTFISRPLGEFRLTSRTCPNCGVDWIHLNQEFGELERLVLSLRMFAAKNSSKNGMPFQVKFEIASQNRNTP